MSRLVITDLVVDGFRKFDRPHRLEGLGPGLNLLAAPNEAGKSTLKAALDAALFQRHRLSGAGASQYVNQWHEAPPAVRVAFELDGARYSLAKRFYKQQKAMLHRPDGTSVEGDAAERELQALLGFQAPERGGMKAELLGVWGLLWASQGDTIQPLAVSETARDSLAECLAASGVAAVTGGRRGSAVPTRVRDALAAYVTPGRGQPTGRYRQLLEERKGLEQALAAAEALQRELAEQTQALLTTRRDLAAEQRGTDEEAEAEAIRGLRVRLAEAQQLAQQIENAAMAVSLAGQEVKVAEDAAKRRREAIASLDKHAEALRKATAAAEAAAAAAEGHAKAVSAAEGKASEAGAAAKAAKAKLESIARRRGLVARQTALSRDRERLEQALAAARESQSLHQQASALPCTPAEVKRLRGLAGALSTASAAREAAATALRFHLSAEGAAAVRLEGETLAADAVVDLLQPARLDLGRLGHVEIAPRVQDADALERGLQQAKAALAEALAALGVADVAAAEAQGERLAGLLGQARSAADKAKTLVPDAASIGDLAARLQQAEADLGELATALDELEPAAADNLDEAEDAARTAAVVADAALEAGQTALNQARQERALAKQASGHASGVEREAQTAHEAARQALEAARSAAADEALEEGIATAAAKHRAAETALSGLKDKAEGLGTPERVQAQLDRAETARTNRQRRIATQRETIARLEEQVRAASAKGPDEALAEARESLERVAAEVARIERDKDALQLLDRALGEAAREAEARYLAPLTRQLRPYIGDLLGHAELQLNEQFSPAGLSRTAGPEAFGQLSAGTQEQLSILTRLAFADVLAAQDRPAVVLLDDALLYCDDVRLESMFGALEQAAERFQIIVFTCHARAFDGLGGLAQRRLSIQPAEAIGF